MEIVAVSVLISEVQQLPKIPPVQLPITVLPPDPPMPTKCPSVTEITLKPTAACSCGPTTSTSFTISTLKSSTGRTTTLKPISPTTTPNPFLDKICLNFEANAQTYSNLCRTTGTHTLNLFSSSIWACHPGYFAASVVSDADIATILKAHNNYRTKVAQGLESQGSPAGPHPKASNMRELKWDNELACIAAAWAHQ
uniref:SCP domain-containing protein n=1 Tax=Daphnia galeata TaxID=27404 RepID=A0A8J2WKQ6_9CRUS|nr:unnamed protein product [Daphnia galeata]